MKKRAFLLLICLLTLTVSICLFTACEKGDPGKTGIGIKSIDLVSSNSNVDTYKITYTNDTETTFTVTNGINGSDGANGKDGIGITNATLNTSGELVLSFSNGSSLNLGSIIGSKGDTGAAGSNGKDGVGIQNAAIDTNGKLTISLTNGTTLDLGNIKGADGKNGENGVSVTKSEINPNGELILHYSNNTSTNLGKVVGSNGSNGVGIQNVTISESGNLTVTLTNSSVVNLGNIKGNDGEDGITPQLKIGTDNYWHVSYDNGATWKSLNMKASGEKGETGETGKSAYDLVVESGYKGTLQEWLDSLVGNSVITPQLKVGNDDYWYVSYDGGTTWESLNIKANVKQETEGSEGLDYYPLSDGTYGVKLGRAIYLNKIVIPSTYNGKSVTQIFYQEIDDQPGILSITIPESIVSIADEVFEEFNNLVEVINKSSLDITAGSNSHGCIAQNALIVHSGESKIENKDGYLFLNNDGEIYLLGYAGTETELVLPETYNGQSYQIISGAFANNGKIKSIVIPKTVTAIKESTFYNCVGLTTVYYTGDIASWCEIEFDSWYGNPLEYAKYLYIDNKLVEGELVIPDTVTSIASKAFYNCTGITSVTIGNSVESIGSQAFYNCTGIASVTIGNSVESIGSYAFYNCTGITEIKFNATNCADLSGYNCVFYCAGQNTSGITVTFGDNVKRIPAYLFTPYEHTSDYAPNIKTVIIGNGVESMGTNLFAYLSNILTEIKYRGTEEEWENISKAYNWNLFTSNYTMTYNYKG